MNKEEIKQVLELHTKWLKSEIGGVLANLSYANLSYANLSSANLVYFCYNQHTAYFVFDNHVRIGCEYRTFRDWAKNFKKVGTQNSYTESEIKIYGSFIKTCMKLQKERDK